MKPKIWVLCCIPLICIVVTANSSNIQDDKPNYGDFESSVSNWSYILQNSEDDSDTKLNDDPKTCEKDEDCGEKKTCKGTPKKICRCIDGHEGEDCSVISGCKTLGKTCSDAKADCVFDPVKKNATCQCKDKDYTYVSHKEGCKDWCKIKCGDAEGITCTGDQETDADTECTCEKKTKVYNVTSKLCEDRCKRKCGDAEGITCTGGQETDADTECTCEKKTKVYNVTSKLCEDRCKVKCGDKENVICTGAQETDAETVCACGVKTKIYVEDGKKCEDRCKIKCGVNDNVICTGAQETDADTVCACGMKTKIYVEDGKKCEDRCKIKCGDKENVICTGSQETDADTVCACDVQTKIYVEDGKKCKDRCKEKCGEKENVKCTGDLTKDAEIVCGCDIDTMFWNEADKLCKVTCENDEVCGEFKKCIESPSGKKLCSCPPGKSGEKCDTIDDCVTGKYKMCKGTNGQCTYNEGKKSAECNCGAPKKWDSVLDLCRGPCADNCTNSGECKEEGGVKFCNCKQGTSGDFCQTVDGCTNDYCGKNKDVVDCVYDEKSKGPACKCKADDKTFIRSKGECRKTCGSENGAKCENEAKCVGEDPYKLCECKKGTSGDMCENIEACITGQYKNCRGVNGECIFDKDKAVCKCPGDKQLDESKGQCREQCKFKDDCKNEATCTEKKFCDCKSSATSGDKCELITDCEKGGKYEKCKEKNGECKLDKGVAVCECPKDKELDNVAGYCKSKWCQANPCGDDSECAFDEETKSGTCNCKGKAKDKYYDYSAGKCAEPDKCILKKTACGENRECVGGECKCISTFKEVEKVCKPDFCKPNPCFDGATCEDTDGKLKCFCAEGKYFDGKKCADGTCFLGDYKKNCTKGCPSNLKKKDGVCEPEKGFELCSEDCGYGYCVKKDKENYTCSCITSISENLEKNSDGKCILKKKVVCGSNELTDDFTKCNCTGKKYKPSSNGITCELKTCLDASAEDDCKQMGARCVTDGKTGYECKCPKGYVLDTIKNICADPCSLDKSMRGCMKTDQFCYNSDSIENSETGDCKCPPTLKPVTEGEGKDAVTKCDEVADNVYVLTGIPVMKTKYEMGGKINQILLNADLIKSMKSTFMSFAYGYLQDYELNDKFLNVSVWIQFNSKPDQELNRIPLQARYFECDDCVSDMVLWPPNLLLDKDLYKEVRSEKLEFCSDIPKTTLCGKEAICENNKCSCPLGYKTVEYSIREIKNKFRIERCEDIDECVTETHNCTENTMCVNLPGDFYCQCKANFKKEKDPVHSRVIKDKDDCYDLCTPNPCNKGTCVLKEDKSFDCKCPAGSEGSFCDNPDVSLASAKKSTAIVGSILGVILGLALIALFLLYRRMKKSSYSEDFSPAPRQDHTSEMTERRPVRGMVNRAYE